MQALPPELSSQALAEMPEEEHAEETLAALDPEQAAEIVEELDDDDAADILGELEPETQERILSDGRGPRRRRAAAALRRGDRRRPDDHPRRSPCATRPPSAQALDEIRRQADEVEDFYQVFVVDGDRRLVGTLPFKDLVISRPERRVRDFMEPRRRLGLARGRPGGSGADHGALQPAERRRSWTTSGRLLGRITFDDVIDVVEAETTEDILSSAACRPSEQLAAGWRRSGAEPAAVALRQPAHRVPRGRGGLRLPGHGAAHGRARGLDADHRRAWAATRAPRRWR